VDDVDDDVDDDDDGDVWKERGDDNVRKEVDGEEDAEFEADEVDEFDKLAPIEVVAIEDKDEGCKGGC